MPNIQYGPPGHKGVTQIMGLGANDILKVNAFPASDKPLRDVGLGAAATWLVGSIIGSKTTKNVAIGALGAVIMAKMMERARASQPAPTTTAVQGW